MYKYNLNDVEWGDLFIYDLFNLVRGNATDLSKRSLQELSKDSYAVISAKDQNNALLGFSKLKNREMVYKNVITVNNNGSVGYSFYHAYTFIASSDVSVLIPKCDIDPAAMIFITRCLQNVAIEKFAYGYKAANDRLRKTKILLPINDNGTPNFQFMEGYIKEREQKQIETLTKYYSDKLNELNMSLITLKKSWGGVECREFYLKSLFDFYLSPGDNQAKLLDAGNIPLISSGSSENGICKFILQGDDKSKLYESGLITIDMFGKVFYHPYNFYSVSHGRINILKPKLNITDKSKKFVVAFIEKSINGLFSYNRMCSQQRLQNIKILLPIDQNNNPNWEYMDNFIDELDKKYSIQLSNYFNLELDDIMGSENSKNLRGGGNL